MSIQKSILALNPIAYYPLQETAAGVITDASGNGFNGSTVGASIAYAQAGFWSQWPDQKVMTFPRSSAGYITIPNFPAMGGAHSIALWARRNNSTLSHQALLGQQGCAGLDATFYIKTAETGQLRLLVTCMCANMSSGALATGLQSAGAYHPNSTSNADFIVMAVEPTDSGGSVKVYVDGALVATTNISTGYRPNPGKGPMVIGAGYYENSVVDYAGASIAHVAFFPKALSDVEVSRLYTVAMSNTGHSKIVGTVKNASGAGISRTVRAYSRATGALLGETLSAADGSYTCHLYGGQMSEVFVVALDDDGLPDLQAAIIDRQMPIGA